MAFEATATSLLLSTPPRSIELAMPLKKRFKSADFRAKGAADDKILSVVSDTINANSSSAAALFRAADDDSLSQETCVLTEEEALLRNEHVHESTPVKNVTTPVTTSVITPVKQFRKCGIKCDSQDLGVRICYQSDHGEQIEIPMYPGDSTMSFMARRDQMLKQMFDGNRNEVFCSWRDVLLSLLVKDARWTLYRESLQQKRYLFETIQLVVSRWTCTQWRDGDRCRNCSNPNWRTGCQTPTYLLYLMPLPAYRNKLSACDASLAKLSPYAVERDTSDWKKRMPHASVR